MHLAVEIKFSIVCLTYTLFWSSVLHCRVSLLLGKAILLVWMSLDITCWNCLGLIFMTWCKHDRRKISCRRIWLDSSQNRTYLDFNRRVNSCEELFRNGSRVDGVYELNVGTRRLQVFCDFQHVGGNWAVWTFPSECFRNKCFRYECFRYECFRHECFRFIAA